MTGIAPDGTSCDLRLLRAMLHPIARSDARLGLWMSALRSANNVSVGMGVSTHDVAVSQMLSLLYHHPTGDLHLRGDFVVALWDGQRARLLIARSLSGLRPCVYTHVGQRLLCASDATQLLALTAQDLADNASEQIARDLDWMHSG